MSRALRGVIAVVAALLVAAPASADDIPAGFDLFETDPEQTVFHFQDRATIPANFFDQGSTAFTGDVAFGGEPLVSFQGHDAGDADTIVQRPDAARFSGPSGQQQAFTDIELVQLSLASMQPIQVQVEGATQLWDVQAGASPTRPSTGQLRILQTEAQGGALDSRLRVYPEFTFTRLSDGAKKVLDVGALPDGSRPDDQLVLGADRVPWRAGCVAPALAVPGLNDGFCVSQTPAGLKELTVESAPLAAHGVVPAQPRLEHFRCYSTRGGGAFKPRTVKLVDQFGDADARVTGRLGLCAPAKKNSEPLVNKAAHLQCFAVKRSGFRARRVAVRNQFGAAELDVVAPSSLCLPSVKTAPKRKNPPALRPAQRIDHFSCYRVKPVGRAPGRVVKLADQFGRDKVKVGPADRLCVPASKNGGQILHRVRHLVCYRARHVSGPKLKPRTKRVTNQFGTGIFRVRVRAGLCVPSVKRAL